MTTGTVPACPKCAKGGTGPHPDFCTPEMRFWRKVRIGTGCWEWQGARTTRGYGMIRLGTKRKEYAHRFAYERTVGALAADQVVMHRCDNPRCVRAAHLAAGTQADNIADAAAKGRLRICTTRRTHCRRGHPFDSDNTYTDPAGNRECRICRRESMRAWRARKEAA